MIIPMFKYDFLVYYDDFNKFLNGLKDLGVLHIKPHHSDSSGTISNIQTNLKKIREIKSLLLKHKTETSCERISPMPENGPQIIEQVEALQAEKQHLQLALQNLDNAISYAEPWGMFSTETLIKLKENGINVQMYSCAEKLFDPKWKTEYLLEIIKVCTPDIFFVIFQHNDQKIEIKADRLAWPEKPVMMLKDERKQLTERISTINQELELISQSGMEILLSYEQRVYTEMQIKGAIQQSKKLNEDKVILLSGFVPQFRQTEIESYCAENKILFLNSKVKPKDQPPVLLKNKRFPQLYEFIGKLYSLPAYSEIDLTPFFAPFFMMFFGLCLGDAGYGLLMLIAATLYKFKVSPTLRPLVTLVQWLGVATVIFGIITGNFFGLNLLGDKFVFLGSVRNIMLDSNQIFNFALILGFIQIIFGLCIQIANKVRQYGWKYTVTPLSWIIILFGIADLAILKLTGGISTYLIYSAIAGILLFNDPDTSILPRIGKGIWELYGITGFIGDLLSYIRLFALGISGAILGLVVNDIAIRLLSIDWIGPVLFVLFLIFGHGLNLIVSSLGAFVHPMRLTFVEFYKNAGFSGGGKEYKPFGGKI
ncbi:MAG: hypothetical protein IPM42_00885 [Saprospiraceae bacterium]|nr:hypothetical protein [Saprospiraceae bacterium]